jgi:hypothetical protein
MTSKLLIILGLRHRSLHLHLAVSLIRLICQIARAMGMLSHRRLRARRLDLWWFRLATPLTSPPPTASLDALDAS